MVAYDRIPFLTAKSYSIVCTCHTFLIHLSIDGHLGYFYILAIMSSASVNIGVQISLQFLFFFLAIIYLSPNVEVKAP